MTDQPLSCGSPVASSCLRGRRGGSLWLGRDQGPFPTSGPRDQLCQVVGGCRWLCTRRVGAAFDEVARSPGIRVSRWWVFMGGEEVSWLWVSVPNRCGVAGLVGRGGGAGESGAGECVGGGEYPCWVHADVPFPVVGYPHRGGLPRRPRWPRVGRRTCRSPAPEGCPPRGCRRWC